MKLNALLIVALVAGSMAAHAQKKNVVTARNYNDYKEFDKAKPAIDAAITDETTKNDPKTWFYRGNTYLGLYNDPKLKSLDPDPLKVSAESYLKAIELDAANKYPEARDNLKQVALSLFNEGANAYSSKNFKPALTYFSLFDKSMTAMGDENRKNVENTLKMNNIDPRDVMLYMAGAAQATNDTASAIQYFENLVKSKYDEPMVYTGLAGLYEARKDTAKALNVLNSGMDVLTDKKSVLIEKLNIYINQGKKSEAIELGNKAIELDPKNVSIYIAMGNIFDKLGKPEEAQGMYNKALALDPNNFNTNYSIGLNFFNEGANYYNQAVKAKKTEDQTRFENQAKEIWKKAIPYFETALKVGTKDNGALKDIYQALKEIYAKLGDLDKAKMYSDMAKKL